MEQREQEDQKGEGEIIFVIYRDFLSVAVGGFLFVCGCCLSELNCHSHSLFANPTYVSKHVLVGDLNGIKQVVDHRHKITYIFVGIGWDRESITLCSILEIKKHCNHYTTCPRSYEKWLAFNFCTLVNLNKNKYFLISGQALTTRKEL